MNSDINKFEDLHVWKEGMQLTNQLYRELDNCRNYGLRDQIQRAATSIPSNLTEGFERDSNKEFIRFLYIAKSSAGELRTQLYLCKALGIIDQK